MEDSAGGALVLKLVNGVGAPKPGRIEFTGAKSLPATAEATVLAGTDRSHGGNDFGSPRAVMPRMAPGRLPDKPAHVESQWISACMSAKTTRPTHWRAIAS